MDSLQEQVTRLEERLRCQEEHLRSVEEVLRQSQSRNVIKTKDVWDKLQALSGLLTPLVIAIVGFYINNALQKPQLQLSNAKEMQSLLAELENPNTDRRRAEATAMTLAAFGSYAVGPLISVLQTGGDVRILAAERGLRVAGMTDRQTVCDQLTQVITNRTQLFTWLSHKSAIRLLGDLDCKGALPGLLSYNWMVEQTATKEGLDRFSTVVVVDPSAPLDAGELKSELKRTLRILGK